MKIRPTFTESRLARRIVLLFVLCALLPVTVLAVISFYEVTSQLRQASQKRLAQATKNHGMLIVEHLEMLDSDLQVIANQIEDGRAITVTHVSQEHLNGLAVFGPDGHWLSGVPLRVPMIDTAERKHLLSGKSLIKSGRCHDGLGQCVFMLRMLAGTASNRILAAELSPTFLWANSGVSSDLQFCVFSSSRTTLFCSDQRLISNASSFPAFNHASGFFQWKDGGEQYDTTYWKLLLKPLFFDEGWTIAMTQKHAEVFSPVLHFQNNFILVILLSFWIVLLLSMVLVRRTLVPLQKLQAGTYQIAARRFDSRVEVQSGDEFEELASSFNSMAAQLGRQFQTLTTITEIDQAIFASLNRETIVDGVLARIPALLSCEGSAVFGLDPSSATGWIRFRVAGAEGVRTEPYFVSDTEREQLREHPQALIFTTRQGPLPSYLAPLREAGMQSFVVFPIQIEDSVQAALVCASTSVDPPKPENLSEARQVADQLAIALAHVKLIQALEQLHLGALTALARAIDAKSQWTAGHSERVTQVAVEIGRNMGLSAEDLKIMYMGGLLHDIGKIGTPPSILDKPGKLTDEEMRTMQEHVNTGVRILEPIPGFAAALPIVAQHHEWFNGKGYPNGIAGKNIHLYARIFAVADCFDALISDRPYRKGVPKEQTIAMIREKAGIQFDPEVIEAFTRMFSNEEGRDSEAAQSVAAGQSV